jgi:mRNA-degrading endonuclease RelE of RelBE toxin-antitoxin system
MNGKLLVTKSAQKKLAKFPGRDQLRVEAGLDALLRDPFNGDVKRLQPSGWRRRIGNYRIFYDLCLEERLIIVTAIRRRTSTTY